MSLLVVATYVILLGFIIYLLLLLSARRTDLCTDVRDTMLATEELQKHAIEIARNHPVGRTAKSLHWLVRRLNENYNFITGVYKALNMDIKGLFPTAPAAEWLLDNFYIIEEQYKLIRKNLSRGQYSRLPILTRGYLKGYPRVYAIALEMVAHSNGCIDDKTITAFIQAYQSQTLLSMGELWAVPLMLRIALIESIRNTCEKVHSSRSEWHKAEVLAEYIVSHELDERAIDQALKEQLSQMKEIAPSFVEHLMQKLRKHGKGLSTITALLDQRLRKELSSTEKLTGAEHQMQAEMQVAIGNSITGLRLISNLDWSELFEQLSKVEQILRQDPVDIYTQMDFESRDYYRHEVEKLSRAFGVSEIYVADRVVECANQGAGSMPQNHVGYYLVGRGRRTLLSMLGRAKRRWITSLPAAKKPTNIYAVTVLFLTAFLVSYFMYYAATHDYSEVLLWPALTALLVVIPCSEFSINMTNTIISHIYRPTMLPKLELKEGIPDEFATFVIIPTLLTSAARAGELLHQMEVYYLSNKECNLFFALVGDFRDSSSVTQDSDEPIITVMADGIADLNRKYSGDGHAVFYYMHRKRTYNTSQNRWMGWERKRGAIVEFNRLLGGETDTSFSIVSGDISALPKIKYVITLDADTSLPMGAARRLIGTIAHPLNRAVIDEKTGLVSEGHGLLQPRISIGIPSANKTFFTRIFAGQGGIDPYTTAVSDIYQDIFEEGIYTGKGIFEVDIFRRVLDKRIPENTVLSHDLIEGCHLRAGLVSDIELVDGYPAGYNSYSARQHRWVRGDWQLLPWLGGHVRSSDGSKIKNQISVISRWKVLDNMRRSLLNPSILVLFTMGIGILPGDDLVWIGLAAFSAVSPLTNGFLHVLLSGRLKLNRNTSNSTVITGYKSVLYQSLLLFMLIPHQAYIMMDAVLRTVYRVFISRRNMLEWVTAADVEANAKNNANSYFKKMWFSMPMGIGVFALAMFYSRRSLIPAVIAATLWIIVPLAAFQISKPILKKRNRLSEADQALLRKTARKTWSYFEDFAQEIDNFLPPDNIQEDPPKGAAHRTSPTNIGLLLVSVLSACDMGYLSRDSMVDRIGRVISTIERMEKWKGHLYNWYDTITLETLKPLYVSTVDSGNLVGYLMVVREGLKEYLKRQVPHVTLAQGFLDTLGLVAEEGGIQLDELTRQGLKSLASGGKMDLLKWSDALRKIDTAYNQKSPDLDGNTKKWGSKLVEAIQQNKKELEAYYPYLEQTDLLNVMKVLNAESVELLHNSENPEELTRCYKKAIQLLTVWKKTDNKNWGRSMKEQAQRLESLLRIAVDHIEYRKKLISDLVERISKLIDETKFLPLFDQKRLLFSIGYNVEDGHLSKSYYDLLASEARQASYIAIARGEVDRRHWVRLGRKLTSGDGGKGLVSWTGTMFEYLMPLLIMRNYENAIFDETYSFVVRVQKKYGKQNHIPWGISESGYSALDFSLNYQYKAFGVPELGLKRGLANDMVATPYATILALSIDPEAVVDNLRELDHLGMDADCGYYEAIDFTPSRLDRDIKYHIVKSFMAHHQGMSLAALNNFFHADILQQRFHADPVIQSAELLLQEKIPEKVLYTKEYRDSYSVQIRKTEQGTGDAVRTFGIPKVLPPNAHILSNGVYSVMVTDGGSGYSMDGNIAVTRWMSDVFSNNGFYIFIHNINSNTAWSATYDPIRVEPEKYRVVYSPDKAEYSRRDGNLETYLEITVSPEDNAEIRRVSITNHSNHVRIVELTSYFEAVMATRQEDAAHPAFSKLFVKTEFVKEKMCLIATRRQRKEDQKPLWLVHTLAVDGNASIGDMQFETDRMKFLGRNRDISNPEALEPDQPLSNSEGSVLDPVMSLRRRVRIHPGQTVRAVYAVAATQTKKHALEIADKYNDYKTSDRAFELSWTRSQVENRYLGLEAGEIEFYLELVPFILYNNPQRKEFSGYIRENTGAQQDLWPFGISGDLPIILIEVNNNEDLDLVFWGLKGHEFWKLKGLLTDMVILINKKEGYSQPLNDQVSNAVAASHARDLLNRYGGVFVRNSSEMDRSQTALFYTAAKIVVRDSIETLKNSLREMRKPFETVQALEKCNDLDRQASIVVHHAVQERKLLFFNGIGGFSEDGTEYVIQLGNGRHTPAPWVNIIANRSFGFIISESGGGYTWAENSREFKLTPWANDPVTDRQGEVFYISDLEERCHWSLTPMPAGDNEVYTVRHGRGYSVFEHNSYGINQSLTMFAALDEPVKICLISLENLTGRTRNLSITYYIRPVLGVDDNQTSPFIVTWQDPNGILFAENKYTQEFSGRVAFCYTNGNNISITGDRTAFIGKGGNLSEPAGLMSENLSGITGAGLDPCAALSGKVRLEPEEKLQVVFLLGCTPTIQQGVELALKYNDADSADQELDRVKSFWREKLGSIQVHTPDDSFDVMINGWFMYQTIVCRMWARSGYYQAGGAFGFRDQLQDSMAILNTWPELTRSQILLHASRQFKEGDVQHWWHAERGKGIRTRYSDDLLWLAYVTAEYIEKTGDTAILGEQMHFLEGSILKENEDEKYEEPIRSDLTANLYEHCTLAIDRSLDTGPHGLPLIGSGDWNDGMNTVGNKGRGESVWLGWFLISILHKFVPVCQLMKDFRRVEIYRDVAARLQENMEREAWDGSWYKRAYFDDGTPLGSVQNSECMIDSISQSWSVLSGVAKPQRMREAMAAVLNHLVVAEEGIIRLLTPPFDTGNLQPGYIKGYVPGVRENGGQYSHAAAWVVLAFAKLGMGDKAGELFHMLNPVNHTRTNMEYSRYKVEPYVMAADVYAVHPHAGRGGWTWYTGAAGWLHKVGLESIIGFRKKGNKLYINPCIPRSWSYFEIEYHEGESDYHIEVKNPDRVSTGVSILFIDGTPCPEGFINLANGGSHKVEVIMGIPLSPE